MQGPAGQQDGRAGQGTLRSSEGSAASPDRKKDLSKMKSLLDILTDPSALCSCAQPGGVSLPCSQRGLHPAALTAFCWALAPTCGWPWPGQRKPAGWQKGAELTGAGRGGTDLLRGVTGARPSRPAPLATELLRPESAGTLSRWSGLRTLLLSWGLWLQSPAPRECSPCSVHPHECWALRGPVRET